jgi:hypothetical protein
MLLAIQSFLLQTAELGIGTDLKFLARRGHAQGSGFCIAFGLASERGCNRSHCVFVQDSHCTVERNPKIFPDLVADVQVQAEGSGK